MAKRQCDIFSYLSADNSTCVISNNNENDDVPAKRINSEMNLPSENASSSSFSDNSPDDYAKGGSSMEAQTVSPSSTTGKLNAEKPTRPFLETTEYPSSKFGGGKNRSFQSGWFKKYFWLEYCVETDSACCFACRNFNFEGKCNKLFSVTGYRAWDKALESDRGLVAHNKNLPHLRACEKWKDRDRRNKTDSNVDQLAVGKCLEKHNMYMEAAFIVIKTLVANGQPLRGHMEKTDFKNEDVSGGLYFETLANMVFPLRPYIANAAKHLPENAKYTSPEIQNEIITILATCVKNKIAQEIREAEMFTVYADCTSDADGNEIFAIVIRYVSKKDTQVKEHVLDVVEAPDRSAKGLMMIIKNVLAENDLPHDGIVAQCYDGASVMSGEKGGLQTLLSETCGRCIIYVHCYCHHIHLVVMDIMDSVQLMKDHFSILSKLYNFFKLLHVRKIYSGTALKKLLVTRWSGHYESSFASRENSIEVIHTLEECRRSVDLGVEHRSTAIGLMNFVKSTRYLVTNEFVHDFLSTLNITVKVLQERGQALSTVNNIINSCRRLLIKKREHWGEEFVSHEMEKMRIKHSLPVRSSGARNVPKHFDDSIITESLPQTSENDEEILYRSIIEVTDYFKEDFDRQFSEKNITIWQAVDHLLPGTENFLCSTSLQPLLDYAMTVPVISKKLNARKAGSLSAECEVFKGPLMETVWPPNEQGIVDMRDVAAYVIKSFSNVAPILCILYQVALTIGFTSASVECVFSRQTIIDSARRRSMTPYRQCKLTLLYFEKQLCKEVTYEQFKKEWRKKPRRITL